MLTREAELDHLLARVRTLLTIDPKLPALASLQAVAFALIRMRAASHSIFGSGLFADPAHDILLGLFASDAAGKKVSVSDCALIAGVPGTTGLRWISRLEREGLVKRSQDERDGRRVLMQLTPAARAMMLRYLASWPINPSPSE